MALRAGSQTKLSTQRPGFTIIAPSDRIAGAVAAG